MAEASISPPLLSRCTYVAAKYSRMAVLDYILSLNASKSVLSQAMNGGGKGGDIKVIEYLVSKGGDDYVSLLGGASEGGHLIIVKKYYSKLKPEELRGVFYIALYDLSLDIVKYLFERSVVARATLHKALNNIQKTRKQVFKRLEDRSKLGSKDIATLERESKDLLSMIEYLEYQKAQNY